MIRIEVLISVVLFGLALCTTLPNVLLISSVLFTVLAFLAATHDIAIDGYYLEALDQEGQSKYVGFRAMAWKVSAFVIAGPLFVIYAKLGWPAALLLVALVMLALTLFHIVALPSIEVPKLSFTDLARQLATFRTLIIGTVLAIAVAGARAIVLSDRVQHGIADNEVLAKISVSGWIGLALLVALIVVLAMLPYLQRKLHQSSSTYARAFVDFVDQPRIHVILSFVILLRAGESFLLKMRYAFLRDIGMTVEEFGYANGIAIWATILATMLGGYLISRHGLKRWIWPFVIAQNVLNLLYMVVALRYEHLIGHPELGVPSFGFLVGVIILENFGSGLGTAVFMVYLMRCCKFQHKAAHYAILSALMSVSFTISGVLSGFIAGAIGFANFYAFTFMATIPGMALIFFLPYLDGTSAADLDKNVSAES